MARISKDGNVRKVCGCTKWKECSHAWYVDYREKARGRYCRNLDKLYGQHASDFARAKDLASRAIIAWKDGRDPNGLLPGESPTLGALMAEYGKRADPAETDALHESVIGRTPVDGRPFGEWRVGTWLADRAGQKIWQPDITADVLERFRVKRPRVAANRNLAYLRSMFNWAVRGGLVPSTPFKVGDVSTVRLTREEARTRRLQPGEAQRLIESAGSIRDLIIGALETGCRLGELLSLQWEQVGSDLFLPGSKTKAKKPRRVPVSTVLRGVLDARRNDPAGEPLPPDAYVFGDEVGRPRHSVKTAWRLTCKRAKISDLHFHDLRREAGSRWMDAGVPLSMIQRWLGHYNISQTSTYLAHSGGGDAVAMRAFEAAIGRLTYVDLSSSATGSEASRSDQGASETTSKDAVVH